MTIRGFVLASAGLAALAAPVSAQAATLLFNFSGDDGRSFTFELDEDRAPDQATGFGGNSRIVFQNVAGTFVDPQGTDSIANISFGTGIFSTLQVGAINFSPNTFRGPALFDGSRTDPQFNLGTFQLTGSVLNTTDGTLSISQVAAVPEPATWAMMLLGFFGIGGMMRRAKVIRQTLSYS